jgi:hypothetical protein
LKQGSEVFLSVAQQECALGFVWHGFPRDLLNVLWSLKAFFIGFLLFWMFGGLLTHPLSLGNNNVTFLETLHRYVKHALIFLVVS